jgi:hypothetical protein
MAERKDQGAATSEYADTAKAAEAMRRAASAADAGHEEQARAAMAEAVAALGPDPMKDLPEFEADERADGVTVRFVTIPERRRHELSAAVLVAIEEQERATTASETIRGRTAISDARAAVVAEAVAEIGGLIGADGSPIIIAQEGGRIATEHLEAIQAAGLLDALYQGATTFQRLPAKKGLRFGQPAGSALSATSAPGAHDSSAQIGDAMGARAGLTVDRPTTLVPHTNRTPAPDAA